MPIQKHPLDGLRKYLPADSFELVEPMLLQYNVQLTITLERQTKLGDYSRKGQRGSHRISVNGNLNTYAFLITLIHELAHLLVNEAHGWHVQPHGKEWKQLYGRLLHEFIKRDIFPDDICKELEAMLHNPAASSCTEPGLQRVLFRYDANPRGLLLIESLKPGERFVIKTGRIFERGESVRKRIKCKELPSGKVYLFDPLVPVKPVHGAR